jgi:hypothetical protein
MISGNRDENCVLGSFVLPAEDGSYGVPPASVIETFWAYKRKTCALCNGIKKVSYGAELGWTESCPLCHGLGYKVIADDTDMVLMYKLVDPTTFECISDAKEVTLQMIVEWISTRKHPHFIGGR